MANLNFHESWLMSGRFIKRNAVVSVIALAWACSSGKVSNNGNGTLADAGNMCTYNGHRYTTGATFTSDDGCNSCNCNANGEVACTQRACATPGTGGDSSIGSDSSAGDASTDAATVVAGCHGRAATLDAGSCLGIKIRGEFEIPDAGRPPISVPCEYPFSVPQFSGVGRIDLTTSEIVLRYANGIEELFLNVASSADCDRLNGGYYYENNDAANSDTIALCPCTCAQFNTARVAPQMDFCVDHLII